MPREKRDRIERLAELHGFLHQSNISEQNVKRLEVLCSHAEATVATLAGLILDVARALPAKRKRWLKLAQRHPSLFERAVGVLGAEFFEDLLAGSGDFDSPLWEMLDERYPRAH
jgi:phosphoenolpyruvate carboxylase